MTTSLTLPDPELVAVTLREREELRTPADSLMMESRVRLGVPHTQRLDPEMFDAATREFLRAEESQATYYLLSMVVNFYPADDAPLVSASVGVMLTHDGPADLSAPIAWSMSPTEVSSARTVTTEVSLTSRLHLAEPRVTRTSTVEQHEAFVLGLGEGQSDPEWRFRATQSRTEVAGSHRLTVVVRAPRNVTCEAGVLLAATVRRRRAGLIRCDAQLPPSLAGVRFPA